MIHNLSDDDNRETDDPDFWEEEEEDEGMEKTTDVLNRLLKLIARLEAETVDDSEEILNALAIESTVFRCALQDAITTCKEKYGEA